MSSMLYSGSKGSRKYPTTTEIKFYLHAPTCRSAHPLVSPSDIPVGPDPAVSRGERRRTRRPRSPYPGPPRPSPDRPSPSHPTPAAPPPEAAPWSRRRGRLADRPVRLSGLGCSAAGRPQNTYYLDSTPEAGSGRGA